MTFLINAKDVSGNLIELPKPISMEINMAVDTPANALSLIVPCTSPLDELTDISVYIDDKLVFSGIVDEQTTEYSNGCTVKIDARSHSALLIDNEAIPANYHTPSLADIFSKHAQPYGIKGFLGNNGVCDCDFTVKKGTSEWEIIDSFCKSVLKISPIITTDGYLDVRAEKSNKRYIFSNSRQNALNFSYAKVKRQRYGVVSEVRYKLSANSDYIYISPNDSALSRGIRRRRLLNLSSNAPEFNEYKIKSVIQKSKSDSMEIVLIVPDICICELYSEVEFEDVLMGQFNGLCIKEISFSLKASGAYTRITLCPEENLTIL